MPMILFLLLLVCFWVSGFGILTLFRIRLKPAYMVTLSLLLGVAVASFVPFVLQLLYITITGPTVFGALALVALLLNIPSFLRMRHSGLAVFLQPFRPVRFRVRLYEVPYWLVLGFLIFVSVWRCYYWPPTSRDALSGPETIAEYTVREQTMINSFFRLDLWSTNNQFKSPFLISLQVIYKLAGFPFGQVWLCVVFISFTVFLYHALRERLHPVLAGLLSLLFMMAPEIYAYTFMILYDYSNMVFFCLGLYFLYQGLAGGGFAGTGSPPGASSAGSVARLHAARPGAPAMIFFAGLLLGIATYIRSETLVLVVLFLPVIFWVQWRMAVRGGSAVARGMGTVASGLMGNAGEGGAGRGGDGMKVQGGAVLKKMALTGLFFLLPSLVGYYLPVQLYINHYLPVHYDIGALLNNNLSDWHPLLQRYGDIVSKLLFGSFSIHLWGYLFYIACALFVAELVFVRRFTREACFWLYAVVVVYLALGFMGFALPMFNLTETTKRAIFKIVPLLLFYLANNELVLRLSRWISGWEVAGGKNLAVGAVAGGGEKAVTPKVAPAAGKVGGAKARGKTGTGGNSGTGGKVGSGGGSKKKNRKK
ncbi:MAG: hypothetical protein JST42_12905 [Bacteroidetes bacterium]|nr:hypothetical protein [Bacteroidota bacterium]